MRRAARSRALAGALAVGWALSASTLPASAQMTDEARAALDSCFDAEGLTAISGCSTAIAAESVADWDRAILLQRRAELYRRRHDFALALEDYDRAIEIAPEKPALYVGRGEALGEAPTDLVGGDALHRARADFDRALEIRPGDPTALARRGHARALLGDLDGAVADYAALFSEPTVARVLAGDSLLRQARENYAFALNARAWERLTQGDVDGALGDSDAAVQTLPDEPTILDTRGHALAAAGRIADAAAAYRAAIRLGGASWVAHYREILAERGYVSEAGPQAVGAALEQCLAAGCRLTASDG